MVKINFQEGISGGTVKIYNSCPNVDINIPVSPELANEYTCTINKKPCEYVDKMNFCPIKNSEKSKDSNESEKTLEKQVQL